MERLYMVLMELVLLKTHGLVFNLTTKDKIHKSQNIDRDS